MRGRVVSHSHSHLVFHVNHAAVCASLWLNCVFLVTHDVEHLTSIAVWNLFDAFGSGLVRIFQLGFPTVICRNSGLELFVRLSVYLSICALLSRSLNGVFS